MPRAPRQVPAPPPSATCCACRAPQVRHTPRGARTSTPPAPPLPSGTTPPRARRKGMQFKKKLPRQISLQPSNSDGGIGAHVCTYFGDTSVVGDWRSRRLLVRSQIARGALTALPPPQRRFGIARLRASGRHARAAAAHGRPQPPGASPPLPHIAAYSPWPKILVAHQ